MVIQSLPHALLFSHIIQRMFLQTSPIAKESNIPPKKDLHTRKRALILQTPARKQVSVMTKVSVMLLILTILTLACALLPVSPTLSWFIHKFESTVVTINSHVVSSRPSRSWHPRWSCWHFLARYCPRLPHSAWWCATSTVREIAVSCYGVASISRLLQIIGLFCKRAL